MQIEIASLPRHLLRRVFGFDGWHTIPVIARPYVKDVAGFLNARSPERRLTAIEIGAGLGDILRLLKYASCLGFDHDSRVVHAARLISKLRRDSVRFEVLEFPQDPIKNRADAVVMVNWVHQVPPDLLAKYVKRVVCNNLVEGGVLVFDVVTGTRYAFHHEPSALAADLPVEVIRVSTYTDGRSVFALERRGRASPNPHT